MENEKSAIEILKEFADKSNRKIEHYRKDYPVSNFRPRFLYRSYAIIQNSSDNTVSFICYSDSKAFGDNAFFSEFFSQYQLIFHQKYI